MNRNKRVNATYLARLGKGIVDIEQKHSVLERTLLERWVDRCCKSHVGEYAKVVDWRSIQERVFVQIKRQQCNVKCRESVLESSQGAMGVVSCQIIFGGVMQGLLTLTAVSRLPDAWGHFTSLIGIGRVSGP